MVVIQYSFFSAKTLMDPRVISSDIAFKTPLADFSDANAARSRC